MATQHNDYVAGRRAWKPSRSPVGLAAGLLALLALGWAGWGIACPFCAAVSQTLSEEMESMQVVVLAKLEGEPKVLPAELPPPNQPLPRTRFVIERVLKGEEFAKPGQVVDALYFGEGGADKRFLLNGTEAPNVQWSTPMPVSERAIEYVQKLPSLPKDAARLEFFQEYLEDTDPMLAADAYDEFAKTPYAGVVALKDKMHRDRLLKWISDPEMPATRKRLYYTMLGICAEPSDAQVLETLMRTDDRKARAGLDALIACYLMMTKEQGLPLIEDLFLKNKKAEYADTYAAIMALRFHGTEVEVLPKPALVKALHHMLDRPELADLVIPDLARWEDWEAMPKLVELFKKADENSSWVRVPVINYLRACPLPEAAKYIEELSAIDPEAVRRANTFFSFGGLAAPVNDSPSGSAPAEPGTDGSAPAGGSSGSPAPTAPVSPAADPVKPAPPKVPGSTNTSDAGQPAPTTESNLASESNLAGEPLAQPSVPSEPGDERLSPSIGPHPRTVQATADADPGAGQPADDSQPAENVVVDEPMLEEPPTSDHLEPSAELAERPAGGQALAGASSADQNVPDRLVRQRQDGMDMLPGERTAIVDASPPVPADRRIWRAAVPVIAVAALVLSMRVLLGGSTV